MPTPRTIEELLKMKPCPIADGQLITHDLLDALEDLPMTDPVRTALFEAQTANTPFKMPDGYYYLPPDKHLGLPLGEWTSDELQPLIDILPFKTIQVYANDPIKLDREDRLKMLGVWLEYGDKVCNVYKQFPQFYNPLDQQTEEAQPAKETETMALPWQDISTLKGSGHKGYVSLWHDEFNEVQLVESINVALERINFVVKVTGINKYTHWFPITPPEAKTVEVPVEPERVSVQEFLNNPLGKWVHPYQDNDIDGWMEFTNTTPDAWVLLSYATSGHPIYATDPTAWLAWLAEQEGNI